MDTPKAVDLPYFDVLLERLKEGNAAVERGFGRHVHFGYWEDPKQAKKDGSDFPEAAENLTREICRAGQAGNGLRVLDVGCGFGGTIAHLNEQYSGMELTGLNIDGRQLERARAQVLPRDSNRIEFVEGDACDLPFEDGSFDLVLAVECIFHFPSRETFFREALRVLKPGGRLALSDFVTRPTLSTFMKIPAPDSLRRGFYGRCNLQYSRRNYRKLADAVGFDVLTAQDITANYLPSYRYLKKLGRETSYHNRYAYMEILLLELCGRTRGIRYYIYGYQKPEND